MRRIERMLKQGLWGSAASSLSWRTPKVSLPLPLHPPDPPHVIRPSVLDAYAARRVLNHLPPRADTH